VSDLTNSKDKDQQRIALLETKVSQLFNLLNQSDINSKPSQTGWFAKSFAIDQLTSFYNYISTLSTEHQFAVELIAEDKQIKLTLLPKKDDTATVLDALSRQLSLCINVIVEVSENTLLMTFDNSTIAKKVAEDLQSELKNTTLEEVTIQP